MNISIYYSTISNSYFWDLDVSILLFRENEHKSPSGEVYNKYGKGGKYIFKAGNNSAFFLFSKKKDKNKELNLKNSSILIDFYWQFFFPSKDCFEKLYSSNLFLQNVLERVPTDSFCSSDDIHYSTDGKMETFFCFFRLLF